MQFQSIKKSYETLLNSQDDVIQSTEVRDLWSLCRNVDPRVCSASAHALFMLVKNGRVDVQYVMNGLVNQVPNAKNILGISRAVTDLLVLQLLVHTDDADVYLSPYNIRNPPHPYITILKNSPQSWVVLLQQVERILKWNNNRIQDNVLGLLKPFLDYIFLDPATPIGFSHLHLAVTNTLLQQTSSDNIVAPYLVDCLPKMQIKTSDQMGEVGVIFQTLAFHLQRMVNTNLLSKLCIHLLSFCKMSLQNGFDISTYLGTLLYTARTFPKCFANGIVIPLISTLMLETPTSQAATLIQIVQVILDSHRLPSHLISMLSYPLLGVIASPDTIGDNIKSIQTLATRALRVVELCMTSDEKSEEDDSSTSPDLLMSPHACKCSSLVKLTNTLASSTDVCLHWLRRVKATLGSLEKVDATLTTVIASIFVTSTDIEVVEEAIAVLVEIARKDNIQSPSLLSLFMYKLGRAEVPEVKLAVLHGIPDIATHKLTVAPVIRTIQVLSINDSMKAVSLRLMCRLWKHQDRCFPYLHKLLMETAGVASSGAFYDVRLARAACIRDVCMERPNQHGADMLAPISTMINEYTSDQDAVSVSLVMEGLATLCESEVIDIRTVWSILAGQLMHEKRPQVVVAICRLLSLVPALWVDSAEYESFAAECVTYLWKLARDKDNFMTSSAAYESLAKYDHHQFTLDHLPYHVTTSIREAHQKDSEGEPNTATPPILGSCYTAIVDSIPKETFPGYGKLLTSVVQQEVDSLPRGIYHDSLKQVRKGAKLSKAIGGVPQYLQTTYEKNKQPALRPGLSASLLFGYNPPMATGRDGKPRLNNISQHGRQYHSMLYTLLSEVPISSSDWHRCMVTPQAWTGFMDQCFTAYMEGRKAELEQNLVQGKVDDPSENKLQQDTAWLWARDKLTDLIKSSSRGNPAVQGNCMAALAGLAVAVSKYAGGLDETLRSQADVMAEHVSQSHWMTLVSNTMLAVVDFTYTPKGRILVMCQQRGSQDRTPASLLARAQGAVSLSQILPCMITNNADIIYDVVDVLLKGLPVEEADGGEDPHVLQFHYGLAVGMVLAVLFENNYADVGGVQGMVTVWKAVDALERSAFGNSNHRDGSILGLGLCLASMCGVGKEDTRTHVRDMHSQLIDVLNHVTPQDPCYQAYVTSVAMVTAGAYSGNVLSQEEVDQTVAVVYQAHMDNNQIEGVCYGLGLVCDTLLRSGHPTVWELLDTLYKSWITTLNDETTDSTTKSSLLHGVAAMAGSDKTLFTMLETNASGKEVDLDILVECIQGLYGSLKDPGMMSTCSWLLGHVYQASAGGSRSNSSAPAKYSYLPDSSVLKAVLEILIKAGKLGSLQVPSDTVRVLLESLTEATAKPLPPVHWAGVLSPLMRTYYDGDVQSKCIDLAIKQSQSSPSAALFLSSWILPPLYDTLADPTKLIASKNLHILIKTISSSKMDEFFSHGFISVFQNDISGNNILKIRQVSLEGLKLALKVADPPQSVMLMLYQITGVVYGQVHGLNNSTPLLGALSECVSQIPNTYQESMVTNTGEVGTIETELFTRCYLVALGKQPLVWLNPGIEAAMYQTEIDRIKALKVLGMCFTGIRQSKSESCVTMHRLNWLLELMGHIKNMAIGVISPAHKTASLSYYIEFLFEVFAVCVLMLASPEFSSAQGISDITSYSPEGLRHEPGFLDRLDSLIPAGLTLLLSMDPWTQVTNKVIDWLQTLYTCKVMMENCRIQPVLHGCMLALRHTDAYRKIHVWSKIVSVDSRNM